MLKFSPNITVMSPGDFFYKILVLTLVFRWESTTFLNHFHLTDWRVGSLWTGETVCWASSALCHWIPVWISWIVQNTGLDLRWNWSRKTLLKNKVKVKVGVKLKIRMTNINITTSHYLGCDRSFYISFYFFHLRTKSFKPGGIKHTLCLQSIAFLKELLELVSQLWFQH